MPGGQKTKKPKYNRNIFGLINQSKNLPSHIAYCKFCSSQGMSTSGARCMLSWSHTAIYQLFWAVRASLSVWSHGQSSSLVLWLHQQNTFLLDNYFFYFSILGNTFRPCETCECAVTTEQSLYKYSTSNPIMLKDNLGNSMYRKWEKSRSSEKSKITKTSPYQPQAWNNVYYYY